MPKYRYIGDSVIEVPKGDARLQVGTGDFVDLTASELNDENLKALVDSGQLIEVPEVKAEEVKK